MGSSLLSLLFSAEKSTRDPMTLFLEMSLKWPSRLPAGTLLGSAFCLPDPACPSRPPRAGPRGRGSWVGRARRRPLDVDAPTQGTSSGRAAQGGRWAPAPAGALSVAWRVWGGRLQVSWVGPGQARTAPWKDGKHEAEWPRAPVCGAHSCGREATLPAADPRPRGSVGVLAAGRLLTASGKGTTQGRERPEGGCPGVAAAPPEAARAGTQRRACRRWFTPALAAHGAPCCPGILCKSPARPGSSFQAGAQHKRGLCLLRVTSSHPRRGDLTSPSVSPPSPVKRAQE